MFRVSSFITFEDAKLKQRPGWTLPQKILISTFQKKMYFVQEQLPVRGPFQKSLRISKFEVCNNSMTMPETDLNFNICENN